MIIIPGRVAERAATRYDTAANGCHISTYSRASHGYAQVGWGEPGGVSRVVLAHRASWVHFTGEQIPDGMTIDHRGDICNTRPCVRFEHLRVLTNFENARRTRGRDWPLGECAQGHSNDLLTVMAGRLRCPACATASRRKYAQRTRVPTNN